MNKPAIYLTNLGKYNEGYLIGKWVTMPCTKAELDDDLKEIGINVEYEEYFITDFENWYGYPVGEYEDIYYLNDLADRMSNLDETQLEVLEACADGRDYFEETLERVEDYDFCYYAVDDERSLGEVVWDECGYSDNLPEPVRYYIDYEAFGRDLVIEGFRATENGYVDMR